MIYLLHICDALPPVINSPQPDVVYISYSIMMDIEFSDHRCDISGWGRNVVGGGSSVPCRYARGSG